MFYTSGTQIDHELAIDICQFFSSKYSLIKKYDVEVYYSDLSEDGVKGWQEKNGNEFLIHIHDKIDKEEHIKTLFHELVHCEQDISRPHLTNDERENEAYKLEDVYYEEFVS